MKTVWFIKDAEEGRFLLGFRGNHITLGPEHLAAHFLSLQAARIIIDRFKKGKKILVPVLRQVRAPLEALP